MAVTLWKIGDLLEPTGFDHLNWRDEMEAIHARELAKARQIAARGAALMDQFMLADWYWRVEPESICIEEVCACVITQYIWTLQPDDFDLFNPDDDRTFEEWSLATHILAKQAQHAGVEFPRYPMKPRFEAYFGFDTALANGFELDQAWRDEINARRQADFQLS